MTLECIIFLLSHSRFSFLIILALFNTKISWFKHSLPKTQWIAVRCVAGMNPFSKLKVQEMSRIFLNCSEPPSKKTCQLILISFPPLGWQDLPQSTAHKSTKLIIWPLQGSVKDPCEFWSPAGHFTCIANMVQEFMSCRKVPSQTHPLIRF